MNRPQSTYYPSPTIIGTAGVSQCLVGITICQLGFAQINNTSCFAFLIYDGSQGWHKVVVFENPGLFAERFEVNNLLIIEMAVPHYGDHINDPMVYLDTIDDFEYYVFHQSQITNAGYTDRNSKVAIEAEED